MNRLTVAIAGTVLLGLVGPLGAGCSSGQSGSLGRVPTARPATSQPPPPTPSATTTAAPGTPRSGLPSPDRAAPGAPAAPAPTDRTLTIEVWLTRDGELFPTHRTRPTTVATSRLALTELAAGPSAAESAAGVRSGVDSGTGFEVGIAAGVATVDLPESFYAGGRDAARLRQAQVVYTLTQFSTVSRVGFQSDGEPVAAPVGRADYDDLLPPIVVTSLVIGQRVSSPVTVAGTANVFEATVSVRILDATGAQVATTFTTATCGTGCRGDYSTKVSYSVGSEQRGTVQVYEVSAQDGSRIHVVDIPVILAARR